MSIFMILSAPATSLGLFSWFLKMCHNSLIFGLSTITFCMCIHILHRNVKLQKCQKKVNKGYQIWPEVGVDFPGTVFWISGNISFRLTSRIQNPAWFTTTTKSLAQLFFIFIVLNDWPYVKTLFILFTKAQHSHSLEKDFQY